MNSEHVFFQVHDHDNVATLLEDVRTGDLLAHRGEGDNLTIRAQQEATAGHKIALRSISQGDPIVKYGAAIGLATADIRPGDWVHLHNCRSRYDSRSSHLDYNSGAPIETRYE